MNYHHFAQLEGYLVAALYDVGADEIRVKIIFPDGEMSYTRMIRREIVFRGRIISTERGDHVIEHIAQPKSSEYLRALHLVDLESWDELKRTELRQRRLHAFKWFMLGSTLFTAFLALAGYINI